MGVTLDELKKGTTRWRNPSLARYLFELGLAQERGTGIPRAVQETTALGAAYAAGLAVGYWNDLDDLHANWEAAETWRPAMDAERRATLTGKWSKAVRRSMDWTSHRD